MGKPKKGKNRRQNDSDDEVVDVIAMAKAKEANEEEDVGIVRSKKKGRQQMISNFASLSLEDEEEESEDDEPVYSKPTIVSAFDMLDMEEDEVEIEENDDPIIEEVKQPVKKPDPPKKKADKKKDKKKDKSKKQKNKAEEEDIDAILAGLDNKGKKKNKNQDIDLTVTAPTEEDNQGLEITEDQLAALMDLSDEEDSRKKKRKDKKEKKKAKKEMEENDANEEDDGENVTKIKSAAQKKKDKKERMKKQKEEERNNKQVDNEAVDSGDQIEINLENEKLNHSEATTEIDEQKTETIEQKQPEINEPKMETSSEIQVNETEGKTKEDQDASVNKSERTSEEKVSPQGEKSLFDDLQDDDSEDEVVKKKGKKGKNAKKKQKLTKDLQETLQKQKEEKERRRKEHEEREARIAAMQERLEREKEEKERLEKERIEREKQEEIERILEEKRKGTYMTAKQKEAQRRTLEMLAQRKAQGLEVPGQKKPQRQEPAKKKRPQNKKHTEPKVRKIDEEKEQERIKLEEERIQKEIQIQQNKQAKDMLKKEEKVKDSWMDDSDDEVKESWDQSSGDEKQEAAKKPETVKKQEKSTGKQKSPPTDIKRGKSVEEESEESDSDSDEDTSSDESSSDDESSDDGTSAELRRERALRRIQERKEKNEAARTTDVLRSPVVCVLGHVDTGKTKILDKLRRTHVQDGEAGGITQQIGATNVPLSAIKEQTKMCREFSQKELKLPGLLIIDTPGHESFRNLRSRGSSLCDIAILVVDIMHGLEPQTIESLNLLKERKTPFVIALNKVDRLYDWATSPHTDIQSTIKKQKQHVKLEFEDRSKQIMLQLSEKGLNTALCYENKNMREYISLVPTSAHTGDGMGSLIALICDLSQEFMAKKLSYSNELQATVMEVKALSGLGTTIDVILVNGFLREGQTIVLAGTEGPIVTQIRALLMPQPMRELRVKSAYTQFKEIRASQGVKIIAKELDHALAGLAMHVAERQDEIDVLSEDVAGALKSVLSSIKLVERGVFVQASTLGSLEALLDFLKESKIPYAGINIGPVHKKDIMRTSTMLDRDSQWAVLLAFDVKIDRDAQELADHLGVQIFTADIIYHLFDQFMSHRDKYKKQKQEEFKHIAVFPCKLRILPECVFKTRDPIVCGVVVEGGFVKNGTPICVPGKEFVDIGVVTGMEVNHKSVETAKKGDEVCIKIEPLPGDTPKMIGRHFEQTDILMSKISRASIDAVKNYFRDEMSKGDWQLVVELKKVFSIL